MGKLNSSHKMIISSSLMLIMSLFVFISVTVAWFAYMTQASDLDLLVVNVNLDATLYYEQEKNVWIESLSDKKPSVFEFIDVKPNQKFNYKINLRNIGQTKGDLSLIFTNISCQSKNGKCVDYRFEVKDIKVFNATYKTDIKTYTESEEITNINNNFGENHFLAEASGASLKILDNYFLDVDQAFVIYFSLWFNPEYAYNKDSDDKRIYEEDSNQYKQSILKIKQLSLFMRHN